MKIEEYYRSHYFPVWSDYDILKIFSCTNFTNESYSDLFPRVLLNFIKFYLPFVLVCTVACPRQDQDNKSDSFNLHRSICLLFIKFFICKYNIQVFLQHLHISIGNDSTTTYGTNTNHKNLYSDRSFHRI